MAVFDKTEPLYRTSATLLKREFRQELSPPDPMNHFKILKGQPRRFARRELVLDWYKNICT